MNRVWKRFFKKISKGIAIILYSTSVLIGSSVAGLHFFNDPIIRLIISSLILLGLPLIVILLREIYDDSRREIELENRSLMNSIGRKY